jgi:BTB/POZ domain
MIKNIDNNFLYSKYTERRQGFAYMVRDLHPHGNDHEEWIREKCKNIQKYVQGCLEVAYPWAQKGETSSSSLIEDLPPFFKELRISGTYKKITETFLCTLFSIDLDMDGDKVCLSWKCDNEFLNPKPTLKESKESPIELRSTYFALLLQNSNFSDITIQVEEEKYPAHKVMLAQCPFFQEMLNGEWKEIKESTVTIRDCNKSTFNAFLQYLYKQNVSGDYFHTMKNCIDMFRFADKMRYAPLKEIAKPHLFNQISDESFIEIALLQNDIVDQDLEELCQWFVRKSPSYGENLDLSDLEMMSLEKVYQIGKKYKLEFLIKETAETISTKLDLNDDFIIICHLICDKKDKGLKEAVINALKNKEHLIPKMKEGCKGDYKDHWKAYKKLMTSTDLL